MAGLEGQRLGEFEVIRKLGEGGMGLVFLGQQRSVGRQVAIKTLAPSLACNEQFVERFHREATAAAMLTHQNIVQVYTAGEQDGVHYIAMEYVDGISLIDHIARQGRLAPAEALVICVNVVQALQYAWQRAHIIHRDIKPENILISNDGDVKVADLGLAKQLGEAATGVTMSGVVMGSPHYISPEQAHSAKDADFRADIYSLGCTLYHMLTGRPPYPGDEIMAVVLQHINNPLPNILEVLPGCPAPVVALLKKMLSKDRTKRHASYDELLAELMADHATMIAPMPARKESTSQRTVFVIGASLTAAAAVVIGLMMWSPWDHRATAPPAAGRYSTPHAIPPAPTTRTPDAKLVDDNPPKRITPPQTTQTSPPIANKLSDPKPIAAEPGWFDLLAGVDVKRDVIKGSWRLDGGELFSVDDQRAHQTIALPVVSVSTNYDLRYRITRRTSSAALYFAFPCGKTGAALMMDGWSGNQEKRNEVHARLIENAHGSGLDYSANPHRYFQIGETHDLLIQVRDDQITVSLDGKQLINRHGNFGALTQIDGAFQSAPPRVPGFAVGACMGEIEFHSIAIKPVTVSTEIATAQPSQPEPATPLPVAPQPPTPPNVAADNTASSCEVRLARLETGFKVYLQTFVQKTFDTTVTALNQNYVNNIASHATVAMRDKTRRDEVTALMAEKTRIEKGEGVPAVDANDAPQSLTTLRASYRDSLAKLMADRDHQIDTTYENYLKGLDRYIDELTKAGQLADVDKVKQRREEIAKRKATFDGSAATVVKTDTPKTEPPPPSSGNPSRDAARWLVANGGTCHILKGKVEAEVKNEKDIPAQKFEMIEMTFDRYGSKAPLPTDADFRVFNGIKTLRRVWVRTAGLSDAAFAFLDANTELTWINLEGVNDLTDRVLTHVANCRKIGTFSLTHAPGFTGKGLDKMTWLPSLTDADFLGTSLGDEGLKALGSCPKLRYVRLGGRTAHATDAGLAALAAAPSLADLRGEDRPEFTDEGFCALRRVKTLKNLDVPNSAFGDQAAAAISSIAAMETLRVAGTQMSDVGLAKLHSLTKLEALDVRGTKITADGAAAFKKALPKCQLIY